jgi:hypothetical protein
MSTDKEALLPLPYKNGIHFRKNRKKLEKNIGKRRLMDASRAKRERGLEPCDTCMILKIDVFLKMEETGLERL